MSVTVDTCVLDERFAQLRHATELYAVTWASTTTVRRERGNDFPSDLPVNPELATVGDSLVGYCRVANEFEVVRIGAIHRIISNGSFTGSGVQR